MIRFDWEIQQYWIKAYLSNPCYDEATPSTSSLGIEYIHRQGAGRTSGKHSREILSSSLELRDRYRPSLPSISKYTLRERKKRIFNHRILIGLKHSPIQGNQARCKTGRRHLELDEWILDWFDQDDETQTKIVKCAERNWLKFTNHQDTYTVIAQWCTWRAHAKYTRSGSFVPHEETVV